MKILVYEPGRGIGEETLYEKEVSPDYRTEMNIDQVENIIVKAGSDVLLTESGEIDKETIYNLFENMVTLKREGKRITYVTSGARAAGADYVGKKAENMTARTLCTAGQSKLMQVYLEIASIWPDLIIGQGQLVGDDFKEERREEVKAGFDDFYRETDGIIIVNANDFTWTGETKYDNDALTANLYNLIEADLAIYLSNVEGLMNGFGTSKEELINLVNGIDVLIYELVNDSKSRAGTGGKRTKIMGIEEILKQGGKAVSAKGKRKDVILDILRGENIGTFFCKKL